MVESFHCIRDGSGVDSCKHTESRSIREAFRTIILESHHGVIKICGIAKDRLTSVALTANQLVADRGMYRQPLRWCETLVDGFLNRYVAESISPIAEHVPD